jgi:hypothetical protein
MTALAELFWKYLVKIKTKEEKNEEPDHKHP